MGANRNVLVMLPSIEMSLADGGMGANRNLQGVRRIVVASLADGGMGANRNGPCTRVSGV